MTANGTATQAINEQNKANKNKSFVTPKQLHQLSPRIRTMIKERWTTRLEPYDKSHRHQRSMVKTMRFNANSKLIATTAAAYSIAMAKATSSFESKANNNDTKKTQVKKNMIANKDIPTQQTNSLTNRTETICCTRTSMTSKDKQRWTWSVSNNTRCKATEISQTENCQLKSAWQKMTKIPGWCTCMV